VTAVPYLDFSSTYVQWDSTNFVLTINYPTTETSAIGTFDISVALENPSDYAGGITNFTVTIQSPTNTTNTTTNVTEPEDEIKLSDNATTDE
jgi:hypothetical protein